MNDNSDQMSANASSGGRKRGSNAKRRRGARQKAMQALYQWDFDREAQNPERIVEQFCEMQNMDKVDVDYFKSLFLYATENTDAVDAEIVSHMDRKLDQLDPIERAVLRICCVELTTQLPTPYKVVVNEALEISKDFGADKGYRYINGIADKLAASLRKIEYTRDHPHGNPLSEKGDDETRVRAPVSNVKVTVKEKPQGQKSSGSARTDSSKPGHNRSNQKDSDRKGPQRSSSQRGKSDRDSANKHRAGSRSSAKGQPGKWPSRPSDKSQPSD